MLINFAELQLNQDRCGGSGEWFAVDSNDKKSLFTQELPGALNAFSQRSRGTAMAAQAKSTDVGEIAFAAPVNNRHDVVSVPEGFARTGAKSPVLEKHLAVGASCETEFPREGHRVDAATGTDAAITLKNFFTQVCGLRPQLPLVDTEF
jgi:hypothetical protein